MEIAKPKYTRRGGDIDYIARAKKLVFDYLKPQLKETEKALIDLDSDIFVVWFCKTLQNWKALVSTTLPDGTYYEVTYNGEKRVTYLDVYKKFNNVAVLDDVDAMVESSPN